MTAAIERSHWLTWAKPAATRATARLFCFPGAGAAASFFRPLASELPPAIQLCALQLPGRQNRVAEPAFADMDALVHAVTDAIAPELAQPFGLLGHSMGGVIAFEVARELARRGLSSPRALFLAAVAAPAPSSPGRTPASWDAARLRSTISALEPLDDDCLPVREEWLDLLMSTLRADIALCASYHAAPGHPLDCGLTVLGGTDDEEVSLLDLHGWRAWTRGPLTVTLFAGDHFFIRRQFPAVAALVAAALDGGQGART
jgi:surfactin synthase thioesterase subunit